jgi:hypothetical protein
LIFGLVRVFADDARRSAEEENGHENPERRPSLGKRGSVLPRGYCSSPLQCELSSGYTNQGIIMTAAMHQYEILDDETSMTRWQCSHQPSFSRFL